MPGACCAARTTMRNAVAASFVSCRSGARRETPAIMPGNYGARSTGVSTMKVMDMNDYEFTLTFTLPNEQGDPVQTLDALFDAGCDDAVVGAGLSGSIALEFVRAAASAGDAINSAIANVRQAIPGVELTEAKPDLVGLTDVAEILNCSRQNIRKYMVAYRDFPRPVFTGTPQLWHLWELSKFEKFSLPATIAEVAKTTVRVNLDIQRHKLESELEDSGHNQQAAV